MGASWREKLIVCKLPRGTTWLPQGLLESRPGGIWELFFELAVKNAFLSKSRFSHWKTIIFEGPEALRGNIFRLEIGPKTLCVALGARFRARSITRCVQDRSGEPPGADKKCPPKFADVDEESRRSGISSQEVACTCTTSTKLGHTLVLDRVRGLARTLPTESGSTRA